MLSFEADIDTDCDCDCDLLRLSDMLFEADMLSDCHADLLSAFEPDCDWLFDMLCDSGPLIADTLLLRDLDTSCDLLRDFEKLPMPERDIDWLLLWLIERLNDASDSTPHVAISYVM